MKVVVVGAGIAGMVAAAELQRNLAQAKAVGVLAGKAGHDDVVDATVVEGAIRRSDAVVTSNASHVKKIAAGVRTKLEVFEVEALSRRARSRGRW